MLGEYKSDPILTETSNRVTSGTFCILANMPSAQLFFGYISRS